MEHDKLLRQLASLLEDMGFDYDRFSTSGQQTYDEIMSILVKLMQ